MGGDRIGFEDFRRLAERGDLSPHERIGFRDEDRAGREEAIVADIAAKLPMLGQPGAVTVDVGCGSGPLADLIRVRATERGAEIVLVDSTEMLAHHPDGPGVTKVAARFPDCPELLAERSGAVDAVLAYSVAQYAFADQSLFGFVDAACGLLRAGGRALIGDLPNASMRRRFLDSAAGRDSHRRYTGRDEDPDLPVHHLPAGEIDDAVALALVARARAAGLHAWLVPQDSELPLANRREDLLIARP